MACVGVVSSTLAASIAPCRVSLDASSLRGTSISGLPSFRPLQKPTLVKVEASVKKVKVKEPLGPSGDVNWRNGKDASGQAGKGKGVYQYAKKYGANVDGYSPIYTPDEWAPTGDVYAGGTQGLLLWALTLAGVLGAGVLLVINTSALAQ